MIPCDLAGWEAMTGCTSSTYRVGLLRDLYELRRVWRMPRTGPRPINRWRSLRYRLRLMRTSLLRRSYWNGWLCELDQCDRALAYKCGKGWTVKRAQRSLVRHLIEVSDEHRPTTRGARV